MKNKSDRRKKYQWLKKQYFFGSGKRVCDSGQGGMLVARGRISVAQGNISGFGKDISSSGKNFRGLQLRDSEGHKHLFFFKIAISYY